VRVVTGYIESLGEDVIYYQNFHSFSQLVLFAYGFTEEECPDNDDLQRVGDAVSYNLNYERN